MQINSLKHYFEKNEFLQKFMMRLFRNRITAAEQLLPYLEKYKHAKDTLIIAIPRGGLQLGAVLAKGLHLPLDVFFTKKIGHPNNPEFAIGVVGLNDHSIDETLVREEHISHEYLEREILRIRSSLIAREKHYRQGFSPLNLKNKTVIVTDDGVATGKTLMLTLRLIKALQPKKIVVAIPVGPPAVKNRLEQIADEVIFLHALEQFFAIGQFYEHFDQVEDEEAITLLKEHHGHTS